MRKGKRSWLKQALLNGGVPLWIVEHGTGKSAARILTTLLAGPMDEYDLAEHIGYTIETVGTACQALDRLGQIERRNGVARLAAPQAVVIWLITECERRV